MGVSLQTIRNVIAQGDGSFYLLDQKGRQHFVLGVDADKQFTIAGESGPSRKVEAHLEGCGCGGTEYFIPKAIAERLEALELTDGFKAQYVRLMAMKELLDNPPIFHPGSFVKVRESDYESSDTGTGTTASLVYVKHVFTEDGILKFTGFAAERGYTHTITDEVWRYERVDVKAFE